MDNGESSYRRYLDGDEAAFEEIVKAYYEHLVFFIFRYVQDLEEAKDLAVDCFAELIAHPGRFRFQTGLKTYLFSIGRHKAIDCLKHRGRVTITELSEMENREDYFSIEAVVLADERKRALNEAVAGLPEPMQQAVHLVYFEDLSCADAARIMRKSRKQVYNLLCRAKAALRSILEGKGALFDD
ncbi:MAG: RNA polymerase sigma factor [Clostridiales bacterium]|nr:RNA polymerase sigma factor [Clostridiales bacterium]